MVHELNFDIKKVGHTENMQCTDGNAWKEMCSVAVNRLTGAVASSSAAIGWLTAIFTSFSGSFRLEDLPSLALFGLRWEIDLLCLKK